ncbi:MAG TPA: transposase [Longimicrobium sp.]|jgi:transposase
MGIENIIVGSANIEVSRRGKRAKTDRLDAGKLVGMLLRYHAGDRKVWSVVRVPTPEEEDRRHLHRELKAAKRDRTRLTSRIRGLLFGQGIHLLDLKELPQRLGSLCIWNGEPLPNSQRARIERAWNQVEMITHVIRELVIERRKLLRSADDPGTECARKLLRLGAIGPESAWLFALEFYFWRQFRNRRKIGALAGLTPTPYESGDDSREQGICKAETAGSARSPSRSRRAGCAISRRASSADGMSDDSDMAAHGCARSASSRWRGSSSSSSGSTWRPARRRRAQS